MHSLKQQNDLSLFFKGKPFNITGIRVYAPTTNTKEAEFEHFYEDLRASRTNTKKKKKKKKMFFSS